MKVPSTILAVVLMLTQTGCVLTNRVQTVAPDGHARVNERAQKQDARVVMRDGTAVPARGLRLEEGAAAWVDAATGVPGRAELGQIAEIRFKNTTGRGWKKGGGWGFLVGALTGVVAGFVEGGDSEDECYEGAIVGGCQSAGKKAFLNSIGLGTIGWLVGMPIGAVVGADDVYLMRSDETGGLRPPASPGLE